jgi:hypothetical protein
MRSSDVYSLLRFFSCLLPAVLNLNLLRMPGIPTPLTGQGMGSPSPATFNAIIFVQESGTVLKQAKQQLFCYIINLSDGKMIPKRTCVTGRHVRPSTSLLMRKYFILQRKNRASSPEIERYESSSQADGRQTIEHEEKKIWPLR